MPVTADNPSTGSEDRLFNLQPDSLYILLYYHPKPDIKYHWGFYDHMDADHGGWKFDIINPGGVWRLAFPYSDGQPHKNILDPDPKEPLGVMLRAGRVAPNNRERVHRIIRAEDDRLNELNAELTGGLSCKVYVKRVCERLKEAHILEYGDWTDLEREVLQTGDDNENEKGQKVVVKDSKFAGVCNET